MNYRTHDSSGTGLGVIGLGLLLMAIGLVFGIAKASTSTNEVLTVQEKERVCDGSKSSSCKYLIWTDKGVFENTDSMFAGKWNSSDVQGQLKIGHTYEVEARGWRIPFFSTYPNITSVRREVTR